MTTQPKTSSKLLIPFALLAVLAAGVAVTSPRAAAVSPELAESKPADSRQDDIRARDLIFHSDDPAAFIKALERAWTIQVPETPKPFPKHDGVI